MSKTVFSNPIRFVLAAGFMCSGMFLFPACDHADKKPEELGTIVDTLPNIPGAEEPYHFPPIDGHENCTVTGKDYDQPF